MIIKVPGKPGDLAKISHRYDEDFIGKIRDEFTYNYETKALWLTIEQRKYARAFPSIYIEPLGETESEVVIPDAKDYITPKLLLEAIRTLPEEKRKAIMLYYFEGMTDVEIGKLFNTSRSTIQYRRTSSFELLKKYLEGHADEWEEW